MAASTHPRLPVRRGDQVIVITGEEKGRRGRILAVYPERQRVLVEGINLVKRATRKTKDTQGGIVEREAPIHVSNVMPVTKWEERRNRRAAS